MAVNDNDAPVLSLDTSPPMMRIILEVGRHKMQGPQSQGQGVEGNSLTREVLMQRGSLSLVEGNSLMREVLMQSGSWLRVVRSLDRSILGSPGQGELLAEEGLQLVL